MDDGQGSKATTSWDEALCEELAVQDSRESMDVALTEKECTPMEGWGSSEGEKCSQVGSEDNLSEGSEVEGLFPASASLALSTSTDNEESFVVFQQCHLPGTSLEFSFSRCCTAAVRRECTTNLSYPDELSLVHCISPPWRVNCGNPFGGEDDLMLEEYRLCSLMMLDSK